MHIHIPDMKLSFLTFPAGVMASCGWSLAHCFPDMCFSYQSKALQNVDFVQWDSELPQGKLDITWSNLIFIWTRSFHYPIIFYLSINFKEFGQNTSVIFKNILSFI